MDRQSGSQLRDPRVYQIAVLSSLISYGILALDFEIQPQVAIAIAVSALGCQFVCTALFANARIDLRSALISTLSLCLLLRTSSIEVAVLAAVVAIGSKFALRVRGKHVFNPTAFGLVVALALTDDAWVSAGQWGTAPIAAMWMVGLGSLVVRRARRSDVTWAFLVGYLALLFGRAAWLGDPLAIPVHAVSNGAFLIFAFFMISDPRTTPDSRAGRILFAGLVAGGALLVRFGLYETNGLLWSLVACAPLVPLIDRLLPGDRYRWSSKPRTDGGHRDDEEHDLADLLPRFGAAT